MIRSGSPLHAAWLGSVPYGDALALQRSLLEQRRDGLIPDTLLLLEHPHVYTLGRRGVGEHVLADAAALARLGAEVFETDRGGEVTYHGPGQLVGYPILSIREAKLGPVAYVRLLEQALTETLRDYGIQGHCVVGKTGVWVGGEPGAKPNKGEAPAGQKIAAIGVRVSAGTTMHGFALNVSSDLSYFSHIVPCGMPDLNVASVESLTSQRVPVLDVGEKAARRLAEVLQKDLVWVEPKSIAA